MPQDSPMTMVPTCWFIPSYAPENNTKQCVLSPVESDLLCLELIPRIITESISNYLNSCTLCWPLSLLRMLVRTSMCLQLCISQLCYLRVMLQKFCVHQISVGPWTTLKFKLKRIHILKTFPVVFFGQPIAPVIRSLNPQRLRFDSL